MLAGIVAVFGFFRNLWCANQYMKLRAEEMKLLDELLEYNRSLLISDKSQTQPDQTPHVEFIDGRYQDSDSNQTK